MDYILIPEGDQSSAHTSVRTLVSIINDQRKFSFIVKHQIEVEWIGVFSFVDVRKTQYH